MPHTSDDSANDDPTDAAHQAVDETPRSTREDVKRDVEILVASDEIPKSAALAITRLFHAMDLLLLQAAHAHATEVHRLRSDLAHAELRHELDRFAPQPPLDKSTRRKVF